VSAHEAGNEAAHDADLSESLRLARRELKLARGRQERAEETLQRVRRERAALREQARTCADALATLLSQRYWSAQPNGLASGLASGLVGRLRPGRSASDAEREQVAAVEASDLFDGGWYLRHQPDAVRDLICPALHYVRTAADSHADPGPAFDTQQYLEDHPDARSSGLPALVHHLTHHHDVDD
jgi:hypothetical protein